MQKSDSEIERVRREAAFSRLRRCLQALALPAARQKQLFPPFVVLGDELALEFDNWFQVVSRNRYIDHMPEMAAGTLRSINELLENMTERYDETLWTEDSVASGDDWAKVSDLASAALRQLGWPADDPDSFKNEYVR